MARKPVPPAVIPSEPLLLDIHGAARAVPLVNPDDIITIEECARRLGVSRRWLYERTRKRSQNPIPHTKFGKKTLRFSWQRISEWWCAHERNVGGAS